MEGPTLLFSNSPYKPPPSPLYASYHTPPYALNFASNTNSSPCSEYKTYHRLSMCEDVLQMQQQQLRFPTPPITPPRNYNAIADHQQGRQQVEKDTHQSHSEEVPLHTVPLRTQSVIMKISHDQSSHHLPVELHPYASHLIQEDNSDTLLNQHHHHRHHHQQQHNDTPSSGTSSPSSSNDFICDWIDCGRYFESLELLAIHVSQIHAVASVTDGLYYCRWSGCQRTERGFNARYKMLVHVRTHTKEKPHQCHLCDKRFSRAENLKIHIRSHSGEKPYTCTFEGCNKAYSNSSDRFKHTRTHSMEKPYLCKVPGCQKRYTDPSSLRKHVKTFKHSVQIMDSKPTTPLSYHEQNNPQYFHSYPNSLEESPFLPQEQSEHPAYPSYHLFMSTGPTVTAAQDTFCMAMEEMCHIRATLDGYKNSPTTSTETDNYWIHDSTTESKASLFNRNYSAPEISTDLTTDKPLDLRVKRC